MPVFVCELYHSTVHFSAALQQLYLFFAPGTPIAGPMPPLIPVRAPYFRPPPDSLQSAGRRLTARCLPAVERLPWACRLL
jgi:hypothetical protein